ncbi:CBM35 domain-containing protein, partial [Microvirga sp. GCM10011540]|uniref:CBM35 domain-containing protein n=1 Tax=Microvirga sp. GCM10011540 TaxID=3317338 RepID=UPI00361BA7DA
GAPTAAGTYDVTVTATDSAGEAVSDTFALVVAAADPVVFQPIVIQAESGTATILDRDTNTNDTTVRDASNPETGSQYPGGSGLRPDYSGTGYVDFGDTAGDMFTYRVQIAEAGSYDLNIRYASNGDRPLNLIVNSGSAQTLPFIATGTSAPGPAEGFNNWKFQTVTVRLEAGENTISLAIPPNATTGPNLDRIEITQAAPVNQAPTAVTLSAVTTEVVENVDHTTGLKVADIVVADDALGTNNLALTGTDAASFEIRGTELYFVGTADYETLASYSVAVTVDDASLGTGVDATSATFILPVTNVDEAPANRAPVVVDGGIADATVAEDSAFNLDLSTRFSDADGESLTFSAAGL